MKNTWKIGAMLGAAFLLAGTSEASVINFSSVGGQCTGCYGTYTGSIQLAGNTLTLTLQNTTSPQVGGYITAFGLMKPAAVTGVTLTSYTGGLDELIVPASASPLGDFSFGVTTAGGWQGGGQPSAGLGSGQTGTYVFTLAGNLMGLTTADFTSLLSSPDSDDFLGSWLAVRFRGGSEPDGWSDKVTPGFNDGGGGGDGGEIPEPGTMALLGGALAGLALYRRRRTA